MTTVKRANKQTSIGLKLKSIILFINHNKKIINEYVRLYLAIFNSKR